MPSPSADISESRWPAALDQSLQLEVRVWCDTWGVAGLPSAVRIELSSRMRRTLGKAYAQRSLVRLNDRLLARDAHELLREVLCHELAHLAAHTLHGRCIRPHGPEWRALLVIAGHPPRATIPAGSVPQEVWRPAAPRRRRARRTRRVSFLRAIVRAFSPLGR